MIDDQIRIDGIWRPTQWLGDGSAWLVVRYTQGQSELFPKKRTYTREVDQHSRRGRRWPRRFNTEQEAQLRADVLNAGA